MTFIEKYNSNPEFKEKHLAYMKEKVQCKCGKTYIRCQGHMHKKTLYHQLTTEIQNLKEQINELTNKNKILHKKIIRYKNI